MRKPNNKELEQLAVYVCEQKYTEYNEQEYYDELEYLNGCDVVVFDNYTTDCPGYSGKVLIVIWGGAPDLYQLFIYRDNKLTYLPQEQALNENYE